MHGRCNTVKMTELPTFICRFNVVSVRNPAGFFVEIEKLNCLCNCKGCRIAKTVLKYKNKVGGHTLVKMQSKCTAKQQESR